MEIYQLRTFAVVAQEGSITKASRKLHLSQPAVSAHIKALEDRAGVALFSRSPRGMVPTSTGLKFLSKVEKTLEAHRELIEEADQFCDQMPQVFRLGIANSSSREILSSLLPVFAEKCPDVNVELHQGSTLEVLDALHNGEVDACFYNEASKPHERLSVIEVARFGIFLAAPPGLVPHTDPLDWAALSDLAWIYPSTSTCCGQTVKDLFEKHNIQPRRTVSIEQADVARSFIAKGVGIGPLHADVALDAQRAGEVELIHEVKKMVRVLFACLKNRENEFLLRIVRSILASD